MMRTAEFDDTFEDDESADEPVEPGKPGAIYSLTMWLIVVSLSALFFTLYLVSTTIRENKDPLELELTQIQATLASTPAPNPDEQALSQALLDVQGQISAIDPIYQELVANYVPLPNLMETIGSYDQTQMAITSIVQNGSQLVVSGQASQETVIIAYLDMLKNSNRFRQAVVQTMSVRELPTPTPLPGAAAPVDGAAQAAVRIVEFTISLDPQAVTLWTSKNQ